jgi:hypothetical protein
VKREGGIENKHEKRKTLESMEMNNSSSEVKNLKCRGYEMISLKVFR